MYRLIQHIAGLGLLVLLSGISEAHDFWLEAHPFYTEPKNPVDISIHVGNQYVGDSLPNIVSWYQDFSLYDAKGKEEVDGELGRDPAGYFTPKQSGTYLIGYQSTWQSTEMDSDTFKKYLVEEGLQTDLQSNDYSNADVPLIREKYIRHGKALVQAGQNPEIDSSLVHTGYDLEIVPLQNPFSKSLGERLTVQVLFERKPAFNLMLIAFSKNNPNLEQRVRTDKHGNATIELNDSGEWLLKVVKLLPDNDHDTDWKSHWASLTFSLNPAQ